MGRYDHHLHFKFPVPRAQEKFRELILFIAERCKDADYFGAVKLNKILFLSDFRAYRRLGEPITGVEYQRLREGPAPKILVPIRRDLIEEGAAEIQYRTIGNRMQHRVVANRAANLDLFTQGELRIVEEVIEDLWSMNSDEVSDFTHDIVWKTRSDGDSIPYQAVFLSNALYSDEEVRRSHELAAEHNWIEA